MAADLKNGAEGAPISSAVSFLQSPAARSFLFSQKIALEATRFWARRAHAYVEQMQSLAACRQPAQIVDAHARFLSRLREDYASESAAVIDLMTPPKIERDAVID